MIAPILIKLFFLIAVAIWLEALRASFLSLSGGYVRSLDDNRREIATKWHLHQKEYGFTLRALIYFISAIYTCLVYYHTIINPVIVIDFEWLQSIKKPFLFCFFIFIFLVLKETLGSIWFSHHRFNLIKYSLPVINIVRIPLKPYEIILMYAFKKAQQREEMSSPQIKESYAENEILSLVEKDHNGELEDDEVRMIKGIFDLNDIQVREVMTHRVDVEAIDHESTKDEIIQTFVESNFSRLPVYKEKIDNILGILYAKDFINTSKLSPFKIDNFLHEPLFVSETKALDKVLEDFRTSQNHFAVVLDQYGGTAGIVTIEDILEEIVGEILDEYDDAHDELEFKVKANGEIIADAKAAIHDINKELDENNLLPESDDYDTIGGCIYNAISRIPVRGEVISLENYDAKILHADERSIIKVKLIPKMNSLTS